MKKKAFIYILLIVLLFACSEKKENPVLKTMKDNAHNTLLKGDLKSAAKEYMKIVKQFPKDAASFNDLGEIYIQLGLFPQAEASFKHAIELKKDNPLLFSNLGGLYYHLGKYEEAVKNFQASLKLNKKQPEIKTMLADVYRNQKKYTQAKKLINEVLLTSPDFNQALFIKGFLFMEQGKLDKTEEVWRKLYLINPLFGPVILQLSFIYHQKKEFKKEKQILKKSVELGVEYPQIYIRYALMAEAMNNSDEAIKVLDKSIKMQIKEPMLYTFLGFMLLDYTEKIEEAKKYLQIAFRMKPALRTVYLDGIAWAAAKQKKYKMADNYFKQVASQLKNYPKMYQSLHYYYHGRYMQEKGEKERALRDFSLAVKTDLTNPWGVKAKNELAKLSKK